MKKVLWFSRHEMTPDQSADLTRIFGEVEINQISKTINTAYELKAEVENADVIGVVAPIHLQEQFLKLAGDKPVLTATSERLIVKSDDGAEDRVIFQFKNWQRLVKIEVVTETL